MAIILIADALFEIIRLRYNMSPAYTGPNKHKLPLERAGIHSQYKDYLDALFPQDRKKNLPDKGVQALTTKLYQRKKVIG